MKFFENKKIWKKIVIMLLLVMFFQFAFITPVKALKLIKEVIIYDIRTAITHFKINNNGKEKFTLLFN